MENYNSGNPSDLLKKNTFTEEELSNIETLAEEGSKEMLLIREEDEKSEQAKTDQLIVIEGAKVSFNAHIGEFKVLNNVPTTQDKLTGTIIENQIANFTFIDGFTLIKLSSWQDAGNVKYQNNEALIKKSFFDGEGKMPGNAPIEKGILKFENSGQRNIVQSLRTQGAPLLDEIENNQDKECYCKKEFSVDNIIDLIYFLRKKQNYKSKKEVFFDKGSEFIESIRIKEGTISENREKVAIFTKELNSMFKKFKINTCKRKIHFIGQIYLETISFQYTYESRKTVPSNYKGGVDFQGRGMKQITHDYNYLAYYDYVNETKYFDDVYMKYRSGYESVGETVINRKKAIENGLTALFYDDLKTFAKKISTDLFHAFNSAGWFSTIYKSATVDAMDEGLTDSNVKKVTIAINGGENNLIERQNYTKWTKEFLKYDENCTNK